MPSNFFIGPCNFGFALSKIAIVIAFALHKAPIFFTSALSKTGIILLQLWRLELLHQIWHQIAPPPPLWELYLETHIFSSIPTGMHLFLYIRHDMVQDTILLYLKARAHGVMSNHISWDCQHVLTHVGKHHMNACSYACMHSIYVHMHAWRYLFKVCLWRHIINKNLWAC